MIPNLLWLFSNEIQQRNRTIYTRQLGMMFKFEKKNHMHIMHTQSREVV